MSDRILQFEGSAHAQADRLLPWLVNGTLQDNDLALVQQHLAECVTCQREVDWLRSLQAACVRDTAPAPPSAHSLRHLRRRLATTTDGGRRGWGRRQPWLGWVIAAQAVLVLALGMALVRIDRPAAATYHTLSVTVRASDRLVVMFDPQLSEAQMRRLLRASDARVVDGPTDAGAWVISVPSARTLTVREALRAAPGVTLVENLSPGGGH